MDTLKRLHENISALADGELADSERELAFAALDSEEGRAAWHAYHLIGDVLRAEEAPLPGAGFCAGLAARLAAEPAHAKAEIRPAAISQDLAEPSADAILP